MKNSSFKNKIIYVAPSLSSFVKNDIVLLSKKYRIVTNIYAWNKKYLTPIYMFHQFFFILINIRSTGKIIISFGGYWSLFPAFIGKLAKVPVYIILNGTDCASIPSINYGNLRKPLLREFCKQSYKMATMLLPVSSSLIYIKNIFYSDDEFSFQGYKYFFPNINTECKVISNGLDETFWKPISSFQREENSFFAVFSSGQFFLKGGDLIIHVAKIFPGYNFYIAGLDKPSQVTEITKNVYFLGKLKAEDLREYYNRSQFYFQLSIFEGFGYALCEAMLCECIPIGSSVNIILEIIGDSGFILKKRETKMLENLIRSALLTKNFDILRKRARGRIIKNYSVEKRKRELFSIIEE